MKLTLSLLAMIALAACSNGMGTQRYLIDPPASDQVTGDSLGPTELREVSLPEYASGQEIAWQRADGSVRSNSKILWADSPERAFTLTLARLVSDISGATVIAEPWPLAAPAQSRLTVQVEKALAANDGHFRLQGRFYLSSESGAGQHHARNFDIAVPVEDDTPTEIARAYSHAITLLAEQIAGLGGMGSTIIAQPAADPFANLPAL